MKKITSKKQLKNLRGYPKEIINSISEIIDILDYKYGEATDIDFDLGGYLLIAENIVDIEVLKNDKLDGLYAEYTDVIECNEGGNYTSCLFLL